ncbi:chemotaxis protein CheD [Natrarchaeobius oligotrophus]|uniref:Probable chemoreceptor glutamine deamidase CheD n=1 Tax=Natrarchaeobius chitinivorans TaxID=1679083 RepID=A0A3N6M9N2_NATCH|nr:chemotaxis protein CheD [Natrarchaeobius chitinivorans]RQG99147.1 chemotaxis protein CheD [Natrarchaeobius chitinivorans]
MTDPDSNDRPRAFDLSDLPIHDAEETPVSPIDAARRRSSAAARDPDGNGAVPVGIADYVVVDDSTPLKTSGLGSCIGVVVHDEAATVSGLLHFMLPRADEAHSGNHPDAKFADTGFEAMFAEFRDLGGRPSRSWAKGAGGATMVEFAETSRSIGARNVEAVRRELEFYGVSIAGTDFGGHHGRSIEFDPATGTLTVNGADGVERTL